jgi:regulatory protein
MEITEIKKEKGGVKILTSEGESFLLDADVFFSSRLYKGDTVSRQRLNEILRQNANKLALSAALNYISRRLCSRKMAADYLSGKGFDEEAVGFALNRLTEYKYVDDEYFAKTFIEASKASGRHKIAFNLKQKGIDGEIIDKYLFSPRQEYEVCLKEAEKFSRGKDLKDIKFKQRLYRHLIYKGFERENVLKAAKEILGGEDFEI